MTELDPSLILKSLVPPLDIAGIMEQRQQNQARYMAEARQRRLEQQAVQAQARQAQAGTMLAQGNSAGAHKIALDAGDFDLDNHISSKDDEGRADLLRRNAAAVPAVLEALKTPDPERRRAFLGSPSVVQNLTANGWKPEEIQSLLSDPNNLSDANLMGFVTSASHAEEAIKAHDQKFENDRNYELKRQEPYIAAGLRPPPADPAMGAAGMPAPQPAPAPQVASPSGGNVPYKNGWSPRARNGGDNSDASVDNYIAHTSQALGVNPDAPLPPAAIPKLAAAMAQFESGGSPTALSVRNNNPGNIKAPGGGFQQYQTPQAGGAAQQALLGRYFGRGQNTIRSIIEGVPIHGGQAAVAPAAPASGPTLSSGDNYIPGGKLDPSLHKYHASTAAEKAAVGISSDTPAQTSPTGKVEPMTGFSAATPAAVGDITKTGPAYLATIPAAMRPRVQALLDGRAILSGSERKQPFGQQLMAAANQADPTFDEKNPLVRFKTAKDYAPGGVVGRQLTQARTVIDHLYDLAKYSDKLGGTGFTTINSLLNVGKGEINDPNLIGYRSALTNISTELPSYLSGKASTIPAEQQTRQDLSENNSSEGRKQAISTKLELLEGKTKPLVDGYNQAMGTQKGTWDLIPTSQQRKLNAIQGWLHGGKLADAPNTMPQPGDRATLGTENRQSRGNGPLPMMTPQQASRLPPGTHFRGADGVERVRH